MLLLPLLRVFGASDLPGEQDRLIATGRLWNTVNYFHPYLAYRDIDWDNTLTSVLPRIRSAQNLSEYQAALGDLLKPLSDPLTQVQPTTNFEQSALSIDPAALGVRSWMHAGLYTSKFVLETQKAVTTAVLPMGGGLFAQVRLSEPFLPALPATPKQTTPKAQGDAVASYPSVELRILAAFKLWGVMRQFFAYRDLMDEDWDQAFVEFLPKFIAARDAREFHLAVAEACTRLDDSDVRISSDVISEYFGLAEPAIRVRLVDKKPVVTDVFDQAATDAGVQIGDLVISVDGENTVDRIKREANYIPFSTQQALSTAVSARILNGPPDSTAKITLRKANGENRDVLLPRHPKPATPQSQRTDEALRWLAGQVGYVDLERLPADQVDLAFSKFENAKAIIFDGRGPMGTDPFLIAAHLTGQTNVAACIVTGPLWLSPDEPDERTVTHTASYFAVRRLRSSEGKVFRGKTALLIDGRTIGNAELAGMFLGQANNTVLIGTASAGAVSQVETFTLPGGIAVSFSTTDVQHSNGGKLQRVGLQPTLVVPSSVDDLRRGKDEVLTRATEYLLQ